MFWRTYSREQLTLPSGGQPDAPGRSESISAFLGGKGHLMPEWWNSCICEDQLCARCFSRSFSTISQVEQPTDNRLL